MAKEGRFVDSFAQTGRVTLSSLMFILKQGTVFLEADGQKPGSTHVSIYL